MQLLIKTYSNGGDKNQKLVEFVEVLGEMLEQDIDRGVKMVIIEILGRLLIICVDKKKIIGIDHFKNEVWFQIFNSSDQMKMSLGNPEEALNQLERINPRLKDDDFKLVFS